MISSKGQRSGEVLTWVIEVWQQAASLLYIGAFDDAFAEGFCKHVACVDPGRD